MDEIIEKLKRRPGQ